MNHKTYNGKYILNTVLRYKQANQVTQAKLLIPDQLDCQFAVSQKIDDEKGANIYFRSFRTIDVGSGGQRGRSSPMHRGIADIEGKQFDCLFPPVQFFIADDMTETTWNPGRFVRVPEHILNADKYSAVRAGMKDNPLTAALDEREVFKKIQSGKLYFGEDGKIVLNV